MSGIVLPVLLIIGAIAAAFVTYRNIRRGGARFYTLERETVLRRALLSLGATVLFFLGAIGLLFFQRQTLLEALAPPTEEVLDAGGNTTTPAGTPFVEVFPPTPSATSTTPQPTVTATPVLCRGVVEGTGGNGLTMRDAPQGAEIIVLPDGTLLTVLEDAPIESGGLVWRKVRAVGGDEGWVAENYLTVRAPCGDQ